MKVILSILLLLIANSLHSQVQWQPPPQLRVPEIMDCTIGDIAIAVVHFGNKHIRYCPNAAFQLNTQFPGAGHFYYVHEYGHIAGYLNEPDADIFAASELSLMEDGPYFINAMVSHLYFRSQSGEGYHPRYGTPMQRAQRILRAAVSTNPELIISDQGLLYVE